MENKYCIDGVMDLKFYRKDTGALVFSVDSAKVTSLERKVDMKMNFLYVEDALLSPAVFHKMMNGQMDDVIFTVIGESFARGLDMEDKKAIMTISASKLFTYELPLIVGSYSIPKMVFQFPSVIELDLPNINLSMEDMN